jgi:tripartite-type tricarboxylate transporter receptor subunit TctC
VIVRTDCSSEAGDAVTRRSAGGLFFRGIAVIAGLLGAVIVYAQTMPTPYPSRPIRMIVPFPPGGASDVMARTIGLKLARAWSQQTIIDNRPGAGGSIAGEIAAHAAPDGYTLWFAASAQLAVNPALYRRVPYDSLRDFVPIILAGSGPNILVAHPSLPARNLKELIALAKARPGLQYASPGSGSTAHLSAELLKIEAGVDLVHVPYKGAAPGVVDVLAGQVPLMFVTFPSVIAHVKSGRLVAIGMTGARRSAAAPDVPTFAETLPGFEATSWYGIVAPAGTPNEIVSRLNREIAAILRQPDVRDILTAQGIDVGGSTPDEFARHIKSELGKWAAVVKKSGARVD